MRIKLLFILFCSTFSLFAYGQQNVFVLSMAGPDSVISVARREAGLKVYFPKSAYSDSLKISLSSSRKDFLRNLSSELRRQGYSATIRGEHIFVLKEDVLQMSLPVAFFNEGEDTLSDNSVSSLFSGTESIAMSQNKIYKVGDPSRISKGGRAVISGYIKDLDSGEPLIGISVASDNKTFAVTDSYGFYRISLQPGSRMLKFKGYGYEDSDLMVELYGDGGLDVLLKERVYSLKGVVLSAENTHNLRSTQMGLEKVRIDRIKHVPAAFGEADVLKIVLTLPGVKSVGEASGGFNVRGGATDQNLILFNDGTIFNPTHLFGLFSAFNADIVNDIELYKSTIPARFGGRISSVLEINSREGNSKKITGSAGIGLLTGKFHIEGPVIKDKLNFIVGVRTTYSDWILGLLPENTEYKNGSATFQDFTAGLSYKVDNKNTLYLNGYYSRDGFKFSNDTTFAYQNANASLKWRSIINESHNLVISAGYDLYNYKTSDFGNPVNAYTMDFNIKQGFVRANFNWLINEKHSLNYGLNTIFYHLSPGSLVPEGAESIVVPRKLPLEKGVESALYVGDTWSITDKLSLELGLRYSLYSALGEKTYFNYYPGEPRSESTIVDSTIVPSGKMVKPYLGPEFRVSARYAFNNDFSLKAGFNSMRQNIHMLSNTTAISPTDIWKLSDANISPQTGWQAAAGFYGNIFGRRIELSVEGYYKEMDNYLDYKSGAVITMNKFIERDVVKTVGRAYGAEIMLKKPLGKLNGWMAYTYSRTMLKQVPESGEMLINKGNWYSASYDKPHEIKLVANYKFTQRFSVSLNVDYSSGRPVTIPLSKYNYGNGYRLFYSDRNAYRIPDYFRMDFSINIEPSHNLTLLTHSTITLGVYNLTGRKNAYSIYYDTHSGSKIKGYKLSIFGAPIPYITYNIKF
ncbi:MAG: TonB-dependent receptor [Bacteroidales bacterium]|nr:TonB-dependent receptor [Bacteroidales bacterium]MBP9979057.1 TonB-dependent receptor [Bacteroidales bacterium]